jgi:hypothetical protein
MLGSPTAAALLQCGSLRTLQLHQVRSIFACVFADGDGRPK